MLFLVVGYLLLFFLLCLRDKKWAIYLIVFTLPAYLIRFQLGPIPMTLLEGEILILFLVWLAKSVTKKRLEIRYQKLVSSFQFPVSKLFFYSIFLFLLSATIAVFVSPHLREAAGIWKAYFIEPILFFVVFISVIKKQDLKNVFMFLCFNVFLISCFAFYQKFTGAFIANPFWAAEATRRVTSIFPYPNALALYLAPIVTTLIGLFVLCIKNNVLWKKNKKHYLLVTFYLSLVTIFSLLAIYFTRSKGALIAILAGLIFYALFFKGYRKIFISIIIFVLMLSCFYVLMNGWPTLQGNTTVTGGDSISTRLEMWIETWQMLKEKPLLGAGLAGFQLAVAPFHKKSYIEIYLYPHNIFLNFWSEIGLLGLIGFLGIIFWLYRMYFVTPSFSSDQSGLKAGVTIIVASMTTLLIHGLVDVPYFKNDLAILFWIIVGLLIIFANNKEGSKNI